MNVPIEDEGSVRRLAGPPASPVPWRPAPLDRSSPMVDVSEARGPGENVALAWRILVKQRWTILTAVIAALALGAAATLLTRPVYTAQATLQIDREGAKVMSGDDTT